MPSHLRVWRTTPLKLTIQAIFAVRVAYRDCSVVRKNLVTAVVPVEAGDDESISLPSWKPPRENAPNRMTAPARPGKVLHLLDHPTSARLAALQIESAYSMHSSASSLL